MNALRYLSGLCIIFFTVIVGLQSGYASGDEENAARVRTTDVVQAFYNQGLEINLDQSLSPVDFQILNKTPVIYQIPGSKERLFIYEYTTIEQRNKALGSIYNEKSLENSKGFSRLQQTGECLINPLRAKNTLLIYTIEYDPRIVSEIRDISSLDKFTRLFAPNLEMLKEITFTTLNNGKTIKYAGCGQMWEGKAVLKYYQYFWKDANGKEQSESWHSEDFWLKYLGKDADQIREFSLAYNGPAGSGQGTFEYFSQSLDQNGYLKLVSPGGNGFTNSHSDYSMTVRWGQGWENFNLAPVNR